MEKKTWLVFICLIIFYSTFSGGFSFKNDCMYTVSLILHKNIFSPSANITKNSKSMIGAVLLLDSGMACIRTASTGSYIWQQYLGRIGMCDLLGVVVALWEEVCH